MKALIFSLVSFLGVPAVGDTYTGVVSDVKHFRNGGIAVDLDGRYPHEKMALYLPPNDVSSIGPLPAEGSRVTATGSIVPYHGKPEIKIFQARQWKW